MWNIWISHVTPGCCFNMPWSHVTQPWTSHVKYWWVISLVNESCHTWMSHVTLEWVMSHRGAARICINGVMSLKNEWVMTRMNESCHIWMSHVTHGWVMSLRGAARICHKWVMTLKNEWVTSHMNESCHTGVLREYATMGAPALNTTQQNKTLETTQPKPGGRVVLPHLRPRTLQHTATHTLQHTATHHCVFCHDVALFCSSQSQFYFTRVCLTWFSYICDVMYPFVTWRMYMCDIMYSYVTWCIYMYVTHLYVTTYIHVWHDVFIYAT